jgi:urease accessory protein UreF
MRALKTERVVTKYWDAVHAKQATGWHTIVFGVVLAVYSIPLRQGLQHYTQQTIRGFLEAGAASLKLRLPEIAGLESDLIADTPALIETALAAENSGGLRIV